MRPSLAIFALAGGLLCSAFSVSWQEDPLAEQVFKNIHSFKGEKASSVLPAMQLMSASLKVDCEYCHTSDFASDDKEEKRTTRQMIAMMRDINEKNFEGRVEVTCATCHGGRTRPVSVPPTVGLENRPRRNPDVKPADVLTAYGSAVGGNAMSQGFRFTGSGRLHNDDVQVEALYLGNKFIVTAVGKDQTVRYGYNGAVAWWAPPTGTVVLPREITPKFVRENKIFIGPESLPKLASSGGATAKIGDRDVVVVSGSLEGEPTRATLYFDKDTGLLARSLFVYPTILGNNVQVNDYSDYATWDGLKVPMSFVNRSAEPELSFKFISAKAEASVDPTIFDPPK